MNLINTYKNKLVKGLVLLFLIVMLVYSDAAFRGASSGLLLWFHNVLPTLLPFIIVSNLIVRLNISKQICKVFHPFLGRIFHISSEGCYPIIIGFLSGLPMGAKTSADLVIEGRISHKEGQFLFTMCNNASPMFIIGYIAITQLRLPHIKFALFVIIYGAAILGALFYRYLLRQVKQEKDIPLKQTQLMSEVKQGSSRFTFDLLDSSIMNGFEIVTRIGGYIYYF
ncbi:MAG TPA: transporter, partial [Mobilitalea sp.]|nr:transporter [Mobilitalea sp.]